MATTNTKTTAVNTDQMGSPKNAESATERAKRLRAELDAAEEQAMQESIGTQRTIAVMRIAEDRLAKQFAAALGGDRVKGVTDAGKKLAEILGEDGMTSLLNRLENWLGGEIENSIAEAPKKTK